MKSIMFDLLKIIFLLLLPISVSALPSFGKVTAKSWVVSDGNGRILDGDNIDSIRSIASITKVMTSMIVLDAQQNLDEYIKPYTRRELIQLAMVRSDNQASLILCDRYPGGRQACHNAMNAKAAELGMTSTKFIESSGLRAENVSTARDLIKLAIAAQHYPEIVKASKSPHIKISVSTKKWLIFNNTNPIIGKRHDILVSKTGWIRASGGCLLMLLDTDIGKRVVIVLNSDNTRTRIPEAEFLLEYVRDDEQQLPHWSMGLY